MKLLIAIVNNDDAGYLNTGLNKAGFSATKIASTGGFLLNGNTTFLIGVEEAKVDEVIEVIKNYSKKHEVNVPIENYTSPALVPMATKKVTVGGATVFVIDVEKSIRL